jgi:hypothetical protein
VVLRVAIIEGGHALTGVRYGPRMRSLTGWVAATVFSCSLAVAAHPTSASASCATGTAPTEEVTGDVVSTTVQQLDGVVAAVRTDDGSTRTVVLFGRYPDDPDISQEDAYVGDLPEVGGRYLFRGSPDDGKLWLSACVDSLVQQLAAPATTAGSGDADESGGSRWLATWVGVMIGGVAIALIIKYSKRRSAPTEAPPTDPPPPPPGA